MVSHLLTDLQGSDISLGASLLFASTLGHSRVVSCLLSHPSADASSGSNEALCAAMQAERSDIVSALVMHPTFGFSSAAQARSCVVLLCKGGEHPAMSHLLASSPFSSSSSLLSHSASSKRISEPVNSTQIVTNKARSLSPSDCPIEAWALDALTTAVAEEDHTLLMLLLADPRFTGCARQEHGFVDSLCVTLDRADMKMHSLLLSCRSACRDLLSLPLTSFTLPHLQQFSLDLSLALHLVPPATTALSSCKTMYTESDCDIALLPGSLLEPTTQLVKPYLQQVKQTLVDEGLSSDVITCCVLSSLCGFAFE